MKNLTNNTSNSVLTSTITLGLAPMDGITDFAFRMWMRCIGGIDYFITPFYRVTNGSVFNKIDKLFIPEIFSLKHLQLQHTIPQLMASTPLDIIKIGEPLLSHAPFFDINCACPAKSVVKHGAGSALIKTPEILYDFLYPIQNHLGNKTFSAKIRTGFNNSNNFSELIQTISQLNLQQLAIHGRAQSELYSGKANWQLINFASELLSIPIIGSGDIINYTSFLSSKNMAPQCRSFIIGRGALTNPFIFLDLKNEMPLQKNSELYFWMLATFVLIKFCEQNEYNFFLNIIEKTLINYLNIETNISKWQNLYMQLSLALFTKNIHPINLPNQPSILSKTKQILSYAINKEPFFVTKNILKVQTLSALFQGLE